MSGGEAASVSLELPSEAGAEHNRWTRMTLRGQLFRTISAMFREGSYLVCQMPALFDESHTLFGRKMSHPHIMRIGWKFIDKSIFGGDTDENRIGTQAGQEAVVVAGAVPESSAAAVEQQAGNKNGTDLIERKFVCRGDGLKVAPSVSLHIDVGPMRRESPLRPGAGNRALILMKEGVEVDFTRHWSKGEHIGGD